MIIRRQARDTLLRLAKGFPVLVVTGPRQSGKTTLVRDCFPEHAYVSLEDLDERAFAREDPRGFLARFAAHGVIFDEVQHAPDLLSYIQTQSDADPVLVAVVLTGSEPFGLIEAVSQSLAGRAGMLHLLPLSLAELTAHDALPDLDAVLYKGLYPAIYRRDLEAEDWYSSYVTTYVERAVRQILRVRDLSTFTRSIRLCAARSGQLLTISSLAAAAGTSQTAARQWLSVLEASYVLFLLQPHHSNYGKRLIKSPKLFFHDTGLAAWLLGIDDVEQMNIHSSRPALFETLIVAEAVKSRLNRGKPHGCYFWRDHAGLEVDLVMETGRDLLPVEIKSGQTIASDWFKGLHRWQKMAANTRQAQLVYGGDRSFVRSGVKCQSWRETDFDGQRTKP